MHRHALMRMCTHVCRRTHRNACRHVYSVFAVKSNAGQQYRYSGGLDMPQQVSFGWTRVWEQVRASACSERKGLMPQG